MKRPNVLVYVNQNPKYKIKINFDMKWNYFLWCIADIQN